MSSYDIMNLYGGVHMGRIVEPFDPNERLLERILSKENLETAWKRVKANHGAPGVDGIAIEQFPDHTRPLWAGIRESLMAGTYQPLPVRRVEIPKPTGGTRPLGIPTVLDRLIQQVVAQVLSPIFDPAFSDSSFGFRPGRSAHHAVYKLGTSLHTAISVAISRKGPWRLSRTLATQTGMTNDWLKDQGLLSVKELWVHIHYLATARSFL